ncbi:tetratricopeptide repeat protein [Crateriforma conspicua]|uniref:Uncharacterized protein n=1 Tax=Crateriforma conspicua TaxID=2527996 RepID=A0A5C5YB81_9PLAN|nr:hypothetical protein [Crateriforma conspicua]TWT72103.1 hypothetical protein Pan14r_44200 [Crateriforma conspicua]
MNAVPCLAQTGGNGSGDFSGAQMADRDAPVRQTIAQLIEKLGHPNYVSRERAKAALQRYGLEALDQLQQASDHPDNQIAMSVRRLIASRSIRWSGPLDPEPVRKTLTGYGSLAINDRQSRIERLADLPDEMATAALARLARFETDPRLSLFAAIALMEQPTPMNQTTQRKRAKTILDTIGQSDRVASQWLRLHASDLADNQFARQRWMDLLAVHRRQLDRHADHQLDSDLLLRFVRVLSAGAAQQGHVEDALRLATANLDLVSPVPNELTDACTWALEHDLDSLVFELHRMHPSLFDKDPVLLYGVAEAHTKLGNDSLAEKFAAAALDTNPIPTDESERGELGAQEVKTRAARHIKVATDLRDRGFFRWAEREFRFVIDRFEIEAIEGAMARKLLGEMHSDLFQHAQVIDVLEPLIQRLAIDGELKQRMDVRDISLVDMRALAAYHRGLLAKERGDSQAARAAFEVAFQEGYRQRIDALIAMYHLDGDDEYRRSVRQLLARETLGHERKIADADRGGQGRFMLRKNDDLLAQALNDYAWLVSNTTGDFDKALRCSQRSIELMGQRATLMDTLARCHFAVGELDAAVQWQRRAVSAQPHFPPLKRQLDEFESALKASQTTDSPSPESPATP